MKSPFLPPCLAANITVPMEHSWPFHPQLDSWLEEKVGFEFFSDDEGRSHGLIQAMAKGLKEKYPPPLIVTIAGTNGKGETCLYLEELLCKQGISVGLFTSPHILSPTERFRFNGRPIEASSLLQNFEKNAHLAEPLSYYQFLFYCFLEISLEKKPRVLILEVGLGGRRDTVNLVDAGLTALTSISHDHTEILGPRLKNILEEKLGITRAGVPLISALKRPRLISQARSFCQAHDVPLFQLKINPKSNFKQRNAILANQIFQMACHKLQFKIDPSRTTLTPSSFGRGQIVTSHHGRFMLLGSHNTDGLKQAMRWLASKTFSSEKEYAFSGVIAGLSRKDPKDLAKCLKIVLESPSLAKYYYLCAFQHAKATPAELLEKTVEQVAKDIEKSKHISFCKNIPLALEKMERNRSKIYLVTGSYYFLGSFLRELYALNGPNLPASDSIHP